MIYTRAGVNSITWTNAGTAIEIGYTRSASDGDEDDWTLCSCVLTVRNGELDFVLNEVADRFRDRITEAIQKDLNK